MRIVKGDTGVKRDDVDSTVEKYLNLHKDEDSSQRLKENHWLVKKYYDMATGKIILFPSNCNATSFLLDFYEYGWGQSFHFAPRYTNETFAASLARHEHYLGLVLNLKPGMHVLDLGCGVGGPAREIARFTGCHVTVRSHMSDPGLLFLCQGVNMNDYQLQRFAELTQQAGLGRLVDCRKSDFAQLPFPDNSIDAVYQIEAFCHAGDLTKVFKEVRFTFCDRLEESDDAFVQARLILCVQVMRVLKPGGMFAGYDWVLTEKYDPSNAAHVASKRVCRSRLTVSLELSTHLSPSFSVCLLNSQGIMEGNGLPDIRTKEQVLQCVRDSGIELLDARDVDDGSSEHPWYNTLASTFSLRGFTYSAVGRWTTGTLLCL